MGNQIRGSQTKLVARRALLAIGMITAATLGSAWGQEAVPAPRNVYLLPMPGGLDQYLALRLTEERVMQVVTDPNKAELILTDRIGETFEEALRELFKQDEPVEPTTLGDQQFDRPSMRPLSRSRGTVFLIDRTNHVVLWSTLEEPKSSTPKDLARAAARIVDRLAKSENATRAAN